MTVLLQYLIIITSIFYYSISIKNNDTNHFHDLEIRLILLSYQSRKVNMKHYKNQSKKPTTFCYQYGYKTSYCDVIIFIHHTKCHITDHHQECHLSNHHQVPHHHFNHHLGDIMNYHHVQVKKIFNYLQQFFLVITFYNVKLATD